jgi:GMP synthase (glutamine-hydrolysing)
MNVAVLQHANYEGPGEIAVWAEKRGHAVAVHHLYRGDALPKFDDFDLLVIMGGEMNIYQYRDWPFLKPESEFIREALAAGKPAIGICLGAQLISDALGGRVVQNGEHEIGWLPVTWTDEARAAFPELGETSIVLHWHGDTYSLPPGATRLASSEGCAEQGYVIPGKCLGFQFHLETDLGLVRQFVESQGEWPTGPYAQTPAEILREAPLYCDPNRQLLHGILDWFCASEF